MIFSIEYYLVVAVYELIRLINIAPNIMFSGQMYMNFSHCNMIKANLKNCIFEQELLLLKGSLKTMLQLFFIHITAFFKFARSKSA